MVFVVAWMLVLLAALMALWARKERQRHKRWQELMNQLSEHVMSQQKGLVSLERDLHALRMVLSNASLVADDEIEEVRKRLNHAEGEPSGPDSVDRQQDPHLDKTIH